MCMELSPTATSKGNVGLLKKPLTALFCSGRCPGDLILKAYNATVALRDARITVISGFHTPLEKDCLEILLRGTQPVVVCPARGVGRMRTPRAWKDPIAQGRLLVLSPFDDAQRRGTAKLAEARNEFVADLADALLIIHAAPGSKTEDLARKVIATGKPVLTLQSPHNSNLVELGARPATVGDLAGTVKATLRTGPRMD